MTRNTFLFPTTEKRCAPWAQCAHKTPCITYHIFEHFGRVKIYKKIAENMYVLPNGGKKFQRKSCIITRISVKFCRNGTFSEENTGCIVMKSVPKTAPDQRTGAAQIAGKTFVGDGALDVPFGYVVSSPKADKIEAFYRRGVEGAAPYRPFFDMPKPRTHVSGVGKLISQGSADGRWARSRPPAPSCWSPPRGRRHPGAGAAP